MLCFVLNFIINIFHYRLFALCPSLLVSCVFCLRYFTECYVILIGNIYIMLFMFFYNCYLQSTQSWYAYNRVAAYWMVWKSERIQPSHTIYLHIETRDGPNTLCCVNIISLKIVFLLQFQCVAHYIIFFYLLLPRSFSNVFHFVKECIKINYRCNETCVLSVTLVLWCSTE
jgi:hypothetical protein